MNAYASTPGSRNAISNVRSAIDAVLADQLVQPLLGHGPVALLVDVDSVVGAGLLPVHRHAEPHRGSPRRRAHHEMEIARAEPVRDAAARLVQHARPALDRPVAREGPVVEAQPRRHRADRRLQVLGALVAEVVLGRLERAPVRGGLDAAALDVDESAADLAGSGLVQQLPDRRLRPLVLALAEAVVPDLPFRVHEVDRGPVAVVEGLPDRVVVVDRDRIADPHLLRLPGGRCRDRARTGTRACARRSRPGPRRGTARTRRGCTEACAAS